MCVLELVQPVVALSRPLEGPNCPQPAPSDPAGSIPSCVAPQSQLNVGSCTDMSRKSIPPLAPTSQSSSGSVSGNVESSAASLSCGGGLATVCGGGSTGRAGGIGQVGGWGGMSSGR